MEKHGSAILYKLILGIVPVVAFSIIAASIITYFLPDKLIVDYSRQLTRKNAEKISAVIADRLKVVESVLLTVSAISPELNKKSTQESLEAVIAESPEIESVFTMKNDGAIGIEAGDKGSIEYDPVSPHFADAFNGKTGVSAVSGVGESKSVIVCVPTKPGEIVNWILCATIGRSEISAGISALTDESEGQVFIHSIGKGCSALIETETETECDPSEAVSGIRGDSGVLLSKKQGQSDVLIAFSRIQGTAEYVLLASRRTDVIQLRNRVISYMAGAVILLIAGVIVAVYLISDRITRPIHDLTQAMNAMATGDIEYRSNISDDDEVGVLAESIYKMTNDLKNNQQMLIQTEKLSSIGRFASSLAHEIQNPLSGLLGYIQLLKKPQPPERVAEFAADMEEDLQDIRNILERMLDMSRQKEFKMEKVNLNDVVERCIRMLDHHFSRFKKIQLEQNLDPGIPLITGDRVLLQQAIMNLMLNSGDAIKLSGKISVATRTGSGRVYVRVRDNGQGLHEHEKEKIFEPFFTRKSGSGTGLGLYVTNEIVKLHNGKIMVESEKDVGTEFMMVFKT